ncbi:MAG: tRNA (adenosine(37)-N6)-threonylcarbamoyltransferase complex dimerization subunit type 1 TsaB [Armatimonadota bacterium]|nr:tRNA (adenosine(37)-N6)-threonylcarbamoyltransferase complex dimerization subunit type 1 TsaB [bacterium]
MLTIAIDSSQDMCTLALGLKNQTLAEVHFHHKMSLLRRLIPNIESMLSDAGYAPKNLDGIVASLGPGSFTGLRIGITTAKSLAWTLGKPIVGVPTLDAIALGAANASVELICPMIFARANEVYWTLMDSTADVRLADYDVSTLPEVLDEVERRGLSACFCGSGATRNSETIRHRFGNKAVISRHWSDYARGAALLELGRKRLIEGLHDDAFTLTPMYIRKPLPVTKLESSQ